MQYKSLRSEKSVRFTWNSFKKYKSQPLLICVYEEQGGAKKFNQKEGDKSLQIQGLQYVN